jgi:ATP-dependent DNA helicase PIF1
MGSPFTGIYRPVFDRIEAGGDNLFLTGRAGSGKTTFLRALMEATGRNAIVLAPTGLAAITAGGQTIHSFFRLPPRLVDESELRRLRSAKLIQALELLVIDEASMVRSDVLHMVDLSLRMHRKTPRPFGGVQTVLIGDPYQLPPIASGEEAGILQRRFGGQFFFHAPCFRDGDFSFVELTRVFRQSDPKLIALLNRIREGMLTPDDAATLSGRVAPRETFDPEGGAVTLTPTNEAARAINETALAALPGEPALYEARVDGEFDERAFPVERTLALKPGARVIFTRNDQDGRWVNGTLGVVETAGRWTVSVRVAGEVHEVPAAQWDKHRYDYDPDTDTVTRETIGAFKQLPLRLAWALTIHKAQGLTFDRVYLELGRRMFAHGQAYVALSRCRTLEGLGLSRPLERRDLVIDRSAFAWGQLYGEETGEGWRAGKLATGW